VSARAVAACALAAVVACHAMGASTLEAMRDDLVRGDVARAAAVGDVPECSDAPVGADALACLRRLTAVLGGHDAFSESAPEDAGLGAVAVWLTRGGHGDRLANANVWRGAAAGAVGPGADAFRLAVAARMADETKVVRKEVHDEASGRAFADAVARAVPAGSEAGAGSAQGVVAATASWVAASQALDLGQDRMTGEARVALGKQMGLVRVATSELEARRGAAEP
jgi:hypothetical protein